MSAYTPFSSFAIKYIRDNKKVYKTVFAGSYGAQVECFKGQSVSVVSCTVHTAESEFFKLIKEYIENKIITKLENILAYYSGAICILNHEK